MSTLHLPPKAYALMKSQRATIERIKAKGAEQVERATHSAIVAGTAAGIGYYEGRNGTDEIAKGAGLALIVAVAGHSGAFMGPKAYAPYLAAAGDGGIAVMGYRWGRDTGARHRSENNSPQLR